MVVLLLVAVTLHVHVNELSVSLIANATLFFAVSSLVLWFATSLIVGLSLSGVTVRTKVSTQVNAPSLTVNVTVLVPF